MIYQDFVLDVFEDRQVENEIQFRVRVSGEQPIEEAETGRLPLSVNSRIEALRHRKLQKKEIIQFGKLLGDALFPGSVGRLLEKRIYLLDENEGLRIRLKLGTYYLAALPWEYVYIPKPGSPEEKWGNEGFLSLNKSIAIVRDEYLRGDIRLPACGHVDQIRMVAIMASPNDPKYPKLELAEEQKIIESAIREIPIIHTDFYLDAIPEVLPQILADRVHIFHFSGHGEFRGDMGEKYGSQDGDGILILQESDGHAREISAQDLAITLKGRGIRLAILNACSTCQTDATNSWSSVAIALIHAGIPAVVGMQFSIQNQNALLFSQVFYYYLAAGHPVEEAIFNGRLTINNRESSDAGWRDWGVPVLYLQAENGILFPNESQSEDSGHDKKTVDRDDGSGVIKPPGEWKVDKTKLRRFIAEKYDDERLVMLCSDLEENLKDKGIELHENLDGLGGESREKRVHNLISYLDKHGHLRYLVEFVGNQYSTAKDEIERKEP